MVLVFPMTVKPQQARINGQIIIDQLVRNMELGQFEMGYSVLAPCIFSVYLHPDDYKRLSSIQDLIKEDAGRALAAHLTQWNRKQPLFRRGKKQKLYRIARHDWWIEFFADGEDVVPPGDVEIHSELNDVPQPGYRGIKTTLIEREPSVTEARVARDRTLTRRGADQIFAEIRYEDDSGPQSYFVTQNEISGLGPDPVYGARQRVGLGQVDSRAVDRAALIHHDSPCRRAALRKGVENG